MSDKYVSDFVTYHKGKRYAPGTPLPADAAKAIHPDLLRKATAKELKAEAQGAEPPDNGDVDKNQK